MTNAQVRVQFIPHARGHYLEVAGYRYSVRTMKQGRDAELIYWKCTVKDCPGTANTKDNLVTSFPKEHNHPPSDSDIKSKFFIAHIKEKVRNCLKPLPILYDSQIIQFPTREWADETQEKVEKIPTFTSCKSALYCSRNTILPQQPNHRREINLEGEWTETTTGQNFLLADDGDDNKILIVGTTDNLNYLSQADTIFADGTFYASPVLFKQIYTIHALIDGEMYRLIFSFLPDEQQSTYQRLFTTLKQLAADNNTPLNPNTIVLDFESGARNSAAATFPTTNINGCLFHYCQRVWKKIQQLGLTEMYKNNPALHQHARRASALPLVPVDQVEDIWLHALDDYQTDDQRVIAFNDYITTNWGESQPEIRNYHLTVGLRTTNHLEGWHHKLNNQLNSAHPNLYLILEKLKDTQAANEVRLIQYAAGGKRKIRKLKYRNKDSRLQQLKQRLQDGDIEVMHYTDAVSHLLKLG